MEHQGDQKGDKQGEHGGGHHVVPFKIYYRVWFSLIAFTIITVASSYIDFGGSMNILIAMGIATTKALLVILFFMGLVYDGQENNVTFFLSFGFLAIFVGLTSADLFYRDGSQPMKPDLTEMPQAAAPVDVGKLYAAAPGLMAQGKQLYGQQCMTCHGAEGKGDGPAAPALTPKPRNFTSAEGWKKGRTVAELFRTLTDGLPGTPMPPFSSLSAEERFALVHYVRSLTPNPPAGKAGEVEALQKELGGPSKPRLSVQQAMDKMAGEWDKTRVEQPKR